MRRVEPNPRLTRALVDTGAIPPGAFLLVDVGASGGVEGHWAALGATARHVAFEPDPAECARLNATPAAGVAYHPYAVAGSTGRRTFHVRRFGAGCSLYPLADRAVFERFLPDSFIDLLLEDQRQIEMDVVTLDDFLSRAGLPSPDFLKVDTEGAELEILGGAAKALGGLLGLSLEVHFDETLMPHGPWWAVDRLLQSRGFRLFDLDVHRYARRALPLPYVQDFRGPDDTPLPSPTVGGKPQLADALYLRDVVDDLRTDARSYGLLDVLKACSLYELYGLPDYAAELLCEYAARAGDADPRPLLDLLVPEVRGERLSYAEHVRSWTARPERFRPEAG